MWAVPGLRNIYSGPGYEDFGGYEHFGGYENFGGYGTVSYESEKAFSIIVTINYSP